MPMRACQPRNRAGAASAQGTCKGAPPRGVPWAYRTLTAGIPRPFRLLLPLLLPLRSMRRPRPKPAMAAKGRGWRRALATASWGARASSRRSSSMREA
eukprot:scaffold1425_cov333-Prasinococcus_capsulatus_cf.AAC.9